jgi:hypothetical protein
MESLKAIKNNSKSPLSSRKTKIRDDISYKLDVLASSRKGICIKIHTYIYIFIFIFIWVICIYTGLHIIIY